MSASNLTRDLVASSSAAASSDPPRRTSLTHQLQVQQQHANDGTQTIAIQLQPDKQKGHSHNLHPHLASHDVIRSLPLGRSRSSISSSASSKSSKSSSSSRSSSRRSSSSVTSNPGESARRFSRQVSVKKMKLTESWPGSHHIRRLFRLFDRDGDGVINPLEFRSGLVSLGFDVGNMTQLKQLQAEMDVDGTGLIRESQFMHAFRTLNRKAIEAKLARSGIVPNEDDHEQQQPVSIQLVKIGHGREGHELQSSFHHQRHIQPNELPDILRAEEELHDEHVIRWYDVCGIHQGVLALLSNFFFLPHEMLGDEIELEAAAHCDFFTSTPSGAGVGVGGGGVGGGVKPSAGASAIPAAASSPGSPPHHQSPADAAHDDPNHLQQPRVRHLHRSRTEANTNRPASTLSPTSNSISSMIRVEGVDGDAGGIGIGVGGVDPILHEDKNHLHRPLGGVAGGGGGGGVAGHPRSTPRTLNDPTMQRHNTLKLLIHSLQFHNFPLELNEDGKMNLVSFRRYRKHQCTIVQVPIHIIIVNDHTLITVRPRYEKKNESTHHSNMPYGKIDPKLAAAAAAANKKKKNKSEHASGGKEGGSEGKQEDDADADSDDNDADDDDDDPNDLFSDFISTLADTDSTSMSSILGLTSSKILAMKLFEEVVDENWSLRDAFKEWKVWLDSHATTTGEISDEYYLRQINDYERLASTNVRLLRPLLATIASLSGGEHSNSEGLYRPMPPMGMGMGMGMAGGLPSFNPMMMDPYNSNSYAYSSSSSSSSNRFQPPSFYSSNPSSYRLDKDPHMLSARSLYLKEVRTSLRLLHRNIAQQFEQANLSLAIAKTLQEQYTQRVRDTSNDTLYLLTVVTTIVTPLQIATGVYGMNWEHFPELKYENGYYYFWGINIALIIMIGLAFKFRESITWLRERMRD